MPETRKTLTIGGLAKAAGVHVETIRYYQRRGLLTAPERPAGGIRRYGREEVERLGFVKAAQRLGFSLNEVAELLRLDDGLHCDEASALAERKLGEVREKIADLRRIEDVLAERVRACRAREDNPDCPLIASLHGGPEGLQD
ncbi:Hg(II)-responsive transcriptional regulator [Halomonas organivorans]